MKLYPDGTLPAGADGWTLVTGAGLRIVSYSGQTRAGAIGRVDVAGNHSIAEANPAGFHSEGWTHLVALELMGSSNVFFFNAGTRAGALSRER